MAIDRIVMPGRSTSGDNRKPLLIGLYSSTQRQGKSTVAQLIAGRMGNTQPLSFATPVKNATAAFLEACGLSDAEATAAVFDTKDAMIPTLGITGRDALVLIGTKAGREAIHPDVWVAAAMQRTVRARSAGHHVTFDDVRFPNEAKAIKALGGFVVRVSGPARGRIDNTRNPTEGNLDDFPFDAVIENNGNLVDLGNNVRRVLRGLRKEAA